MSRIRADRIVNRAGTGTPHKDIIKVELVN
jgi:hypothetical protein